VAGSGSPTVRRRELGALLRALRLEADLTIEQAAEQLLCSPSKVSRMETGHRSVSLRDIRDLCALYDVTEPAQRERLTALAEEGKVPGWWRPYDLDPGFATYVGLEAEAIRINNFEPGVVPGLLQRPDYARAIHDRTIPRPNDAEIDQLIEVRQERQTILTRKEPPPPEFWAVVDEAVLHRVVGSRAIMRAALQHVMDSCDLPNVGLQVLSYEAGAHPALDSTFVLLGLRDPLSPVVYVEGLAGQMWLEQPHDAERYGRVFEQLRMMSLSVSKSIDLIGKLIKEYGRY
jgi:transcriptional regulator with XRE-family HTH domain